MSDREKLEATVMKLMAFYEDEISSAYTGSHLYNWDAISGTTDPLINHAAYTLVFNAIHEQLDYLQTTEGSVEDVLNRSMNDREHWSYFT